MFEFEPGYNKDKSVTVSLLTRQTSVKSRIIQIVGDTKIISQMDTGMEVNIKIKGKPKFSGICIPIYRSDVSIEFSKIKELHEE